MIKRLAIYVFSLLLTWFALTIARQYSAEAASSGTLRVPLSGFESDRGKVVVKLFVEGDDVPKGRGTKEISAKIVGKKAHVDFQKLPHGTYALFAFHDENENGTVDHNLFGIPKESLGFSGGFRVTLISGIPDFDDLKFRFDDAHTAEFIQMR
jgi:uncharacterized protein (DUF2141 family)